MRSPPFHRRTPIHCGNFSAPSILRFILPLLLLSIAVHAAPENLLRNGSFEGGTLYWHQVAAPDQTLVKDAKVGEYALRIAKGNVMSAPFVAERGEPMTVSFFVKGVFGSQVLAEV